MATGRCHLAERALLSERDALARRCGVVLRRRVPGQLRPALRCWDLGAPVLQPVRDTAVPRTLVARRERSLGPVQPSGGLHSARSRREF